MTISLGDFYNIHPADFEKSGALDPILGIDTRLFIDPKLLRETATPELENSHNEISRHFEKIIKIAKKIQKENDVFWNQADRLLSFPEVQGLCIGYSSKGVSGKGTGPLKRKRLLTTINQLLKAGSEDSTIFELVGTFEEGIGPDLISDMIAKIIMPDLIRFTQRVCSDLGIPMESQTYSKYSPQDDLPQNPQSNQPIILVPKDILRDLPVAETYSDIFWITQHNEEVRKELNELIAGSMSALTASERKKHLKESFILHPDLLQQVISAYSNGRSTPYDFKDDPTGEIIWYRTSKDLTKQSQLKLQLPKNPTIEDVYSVVKSICLHFKKLLEENQLCKLLYDKKGIKKHESAAQLLFYGIASAYCEANNLDLSPECDSGRGPVDFKISSGFNGKVLVEIKLTSNLQLAHGFEKQLPIYQKAEGPSKGIYLVIHNEGITDQRWENFLSLVNNAGSNAPEVIVAFAIEKASASKAND